MEEMRSLLVLISLFYMVTVSQGNVLVTSNGVKGLPKSMRPPPVNTLLTFQDLLNEMNEQEHCQTYAKCASDSHHYAQATWKFYFANEKKESFNQSREWCKSRGGDLAKMESTLERKIVKCILNKKMIEEVWIGAYLSNVAGPVSLSSFVWLDGSPIMFQNWWSEGETHDHGACVKATNEEYHRKWTSSNCLLSLPSICYANVTSSIKNKTTSAPKVPKFCESISSDQCKIFANCYLEKRNQNTYDDLFNTSTALPATGSRNRMTSDECLNTVPLFRKSENGTVKLYVVHNDELNFNDAATICSSRGGQLAKIETNLEKNALQCVRNKTSTKDKRIWIGMKSESETSPRNKSTYKWLDGSKLMEAFWANNQPDGRSMCVFSNAEEEWEGGDCHHKRPYACFTKVLPEQTKAIAVTTDKTLPVTETKIFSTSVTTMFTTTTGKSSFLEETGSLCNYPAKWSCEIEDEKHIEFNPSESSYPETAFANSAVLGFAVATNESVSTLIAAFSLKSIDLENFTEATSSQHEQQISVKKQHRLLLQSLIFFTASKNLNSITLNYSIEISSATANVSKIHSPSGSSSSGTATVSKAEYECVYLDKAKQKFSNFGIRTIPTQDGKFVCSSNHTSIFSALLVLEVIHVPYNAKVLTYVTETISVVSLLSAITMLGWLRGKLRSERTVIQINLSFALMFFHISALVHDAAYANAKSCEFIAISIHYFMLASAWWMLLEGVFLVTKTMDNAMLFTKTAIPRLVVGWGVPLLVVSISSSVGFATGTYMSKTPELLGPLPDNNKYQQCWLNKKNLILFIGGLLAPVTAPLILNLLILIKVGYFVFWMSKKTDNFKPSDNRSNRKQSVIGKNKEHIKASLKGCAVLLPVLGVPWILLLTDTEGTFMYVNIVVNGSQGFFILIIYCLLSEEVRQTIKRKWNRGKLRNSSPNTYYSSNATTSTTVSS